MRLLHFTSATAFCVIARDRFKLISVKFDNPIQNRRAIPCYKKYDCILKKPRVSIKAANEIKCLVKNDSDCGKERKAEYKNKYIIQ